MWARITALTRHFGDFYVARHEMAMVKMSYRQQTGRWRRRFTQRFPTSLPVAVRVPYLAAAW